MRVPSAFCGGHGRKTRISPRSSSSECEAGIVLRQIRTILAVDGGKQRILAASLAPRSRAVAADTLIASDG